MCSPKMLFCTCDALLLLFLLGALEPVMSSTNVCSLNGDLIDGVCICDIQWHGDDCERLSLMPASLTAGLQPNGTMGIWASWGGSVVTDEDGTFNMFVSIIEGGCGLNAWRPNSAIGRATSSAADGPYVLREIIKPHFAHSPQVVRAIDGSWLIYHVGGGNNNTDPCVDPSSHDCEWTSNCSSGCTGPQHPWLSGLDFFGPSMVLQADSLHGPWESTTIGECTDVPGCARNATYIGNGNDINPAPLVHQDGSVTLLWRSINYTSTGQSYYALASASAWTGPYAWDDSNIFPKFRDCHIEDGFAWKGKRGYHAIFHSDCERTSNGAAGGHAYSTDGVSWTFHAANAYGNEVPLRDGTVLKLNRRERPKLILDESGSPAYLVNGVSLPGTGGGCAGVPGHEDSGDRVWTLVQPIAAKIH